jgi:hypothetical protein
MMIPALQPSRPREALDQHRLHEGSRCSNAWTQMLARAAKVIAAHGPAPIEPP